MFKMNALIVLESAIILLLLGTAHTQDQRTVTLRVTYKNDTILYCGDGDLAAILTRDNSTNFTGGWTNVSFYRIQNFNTSAQSIDKMSPDPKKYIIDSDVNLLTLKSIMTPFLFVPEKLKISPLETSDIELNCAMLYGGENPTGNITWRWLFNGQRYLDPTDRVTITNSPSTQTKLSIKEVQLAEKGFYECQVTNEFGQTSARINVNVKSALAPLWPFIGVFIEIAVFVLILALFGREKKKVK